MQRVASMERLNCNKLSSAVAATPVPALRGPAVCARRSAGARHTAASMRIATAAAALSSCLSGSALLGASRQLPAAGVVRLIRARSARALAALSAAANAAAASGGADGDDEDLLRIDLDWRPSLTAAQEAGCWVAAAAAAVFAYVLTAPPTLSVAYGTCIALLFGLLLLGLRGALLEDKYKVRYDTAAAPSQSPTHAHHKAGG